MAEQPIRMGIAFPNRGIVFGSTNVAEMLDMARRVDDTPELTSFWIGDSLLSKPRVESVASLGAIAAVTKRVKIGPACFASFPLRDPITLAIQWASLDVLSGGRTIMVTCIGAGEGWSGDWATEFKAYGVDPADRLARMVEGIEVLRRLWTEDTVTHAGRFFQFENVEARPKPIQQPYPIHVANNVRGDLDSDRVQKALRRTARIADGWQTAVLFPDDFAARWQRLRAHLPEFGKDPNTFPTSMYYNVNLNPDKAAAREESLEFLRNYYLTRDYPEPAFDRWTAWGSPGEVIDRIEGYYAAGLQEIIIRFPSWSMTQQLDTFMDKVLPHFARRLLASGQGSSTPLAASAHGSAV
jgi:alkanesulfonate monooxygenase SsuD/methylene tetrahydromethanopterin reductase-like flavin-dependent oxidoreductase (luciferase family)